MVAGANKKSIRIDTSVEGTATAAQSAAAKAARAASATPTPRSIATASPNPAQDTHPYAKNAVIEVWHIPKKVVHHHRHHHHHADDEEEEWYWTESEDDEESDEMMEDASERVSNSTASTTSASNKNNKGKTVRLCDIIDRAQNPDGTWRYYVHFKELNRRMDQWITIDKIVSPPSIGNAKWRALKREEERLKRKQQRKEEKAVAEVIDWNAPRGRRRSSVVNVPDAAVDGGDAGSRRTRLSRRKSMDDDATVVAGNQAAAEEDEGKDKGAEQSKASSNNNKKEILALPTDAITTHTVGEHVVGTVRAQELDEHEGLDEASLREHEEVTKVKNVAFLELGQYQMETWYFSPLPKELLGPNGYIEVLYVCEFTLNMFSRKSELLRFQARLPVDKRHPPGDEIYRNGNLAMFEVDAQQEEIYCQNLSYIAKLFLDHKTLYFSVSPFLFYVLCEVDDRGYHPVGYFSKEKYSDVGYNLACILTFPAHQRKGYGRFLIAFSYELTKKEEKVGSPEKPMSDLGQAAYKPYWSSVIIDFLLNQSDESALSIMDISKKTSIMAEDIVFTLNQLGLLKIINGVYFITAEKNLLEGLAKKYPIKKPYVDPSKLHWTPYLTDIKRDKFSIHSKKPSVAEDEKAK